MNYYAFTDDEKLLLLSDCDSFSDADDKAPSNTHWIFNSEGLAQFVQQATEILNKEAA